VELETAVERATEATVDKDRLLEVMQGDKTALSRAVAQNKELKNQLAELQNSFVKMVCGRVVLSKLHIIFLPFRAPKTDGNARNYTHRLLLSSTIKGTCISNTICTAVWLQCFLA